MDKEEFESNATPRSRRTKSASKAASSMKKFVTRRLAKSISSERDTRSVSSSENTPTQSLSRRFSLKRPKSGKSRQTSLSERDGTAEGPRRSLSVSDMTQLDNAVNPEESPVPLVPIEKDVKVPDFKDNEQFVQELLPKGEGPKPPDTPVPEQRQEKRADKRSSSSVHVSFATDEIHEVERKVTVDERPPMEIVDSPDELEIVTDAHMEALIAEKVMGIGGLDDSPRATPTDGHAEITESEIKDTEIKEVVDETFAAGHEEVEKAVEPVSEILAAENEASTHEAQDDGKALEQIEDLVEATEKKTVKTRDFDLADLAKMQDAAEVSAPETQEVSQEVTQEEAETAAAIPKEQALGKPKRRRRMRIIRSASVSVAALAVGLLIMILKK